MNFNNYRPEFDSKQGFYLRNVQGLDYFQIEEIRDREWKDKNYLEELKGELTEAVANNFEICDKLAALQYMIDVDNPCQKNEEFHREYSMLVQVWQLMGARIRDLIEVLRDDWDGTEESYEMFIRSTVPRDDSIHNKTITDA